MTLQDVAGLCEKVKFKQIMGKDGFEAKCPVCTSTSKHLAFWEQGNGWLGLRCQKECAKDAIIAALGMRKIDLKIETGEPVSTRAKPSVKATPDKPKPSDTGTSFTYLNPEGEPVFRKVRDYDWKWEIADWKKKFRQVGVNGEPNLQHLNGQAKLLYRLPEVLKAVKEGKTVYVHEGEKACDLCWDNGMPSTCGPDGAGNDKWHLHYSQWLKGAKLVRIVQDRDKDGENYAPLIWRALKAEGIPCEIIRSKTIGAKDDAYDHLKAGYGEADFERAYDAEPVERQRRRKASEIKPEKVDWLAYPYFAFGLLNGIDGKPGTGKSFLSAVIAAAVSQGRQLPFSATEIPKGKVLMYMTEDSSEHTTVPRLQNLEADLDMIEIIEDVTPLDHDGLAQIRNDVLETGAVLVIIDPITAFIDAATKAVARPTIDVHGIMGGLKMIAQESGACFICDRHLRKDQAGASPDPIDQGIGDISIIGKYRSSTQLRKDKENKGRTLMTHVKSNIGKLGPTVAFEIRDMGNENFEFYWIPGTIDADAQDIASGKVAENRGRSQCRAWLVSILSNTYVLSTEVFRQAAANGWSRPTVFRAKADIPGFEATNRGFSDNKYRWRILVDVDSYDAFNDE